MRIRKNDLIKKVNDLLEGATVYLSANKLSFSCRVSVYRIYSAIRALREGTKDRLPVGIHSVKSGYILSKYANKTNDVEFMRKLNGARTSVYISANAAAPHIRERWNAVEDRRAFELIFKPLMTGSDTTILKRGKIFLDKTIAGV